LLLKFQSMSKCLAFLLLCHLS